MLEVFVTAIYTLGKLSKITAAAFSYTGAILLPLKVTAKLYFNRS